MKKAIALLVFVIFTFTTSLIYAENYNLLEISQQQKDKIDKVVLKVETIINKQSTKEKKEKLKEKILEQLNDIFLKVAGKGDVDKLGIVNYLIEKIEAIGGASRYPGCSADDINIEGLLFSACNLGASTPNELGVKGYWNGYGEFITNWNKKLSNGEPEAKNILNCADGYSPISQIYNMKGFVNYLKNNNKNLIEELKVPNIDSWKDWKLGITEEEFNNLSPNKKWEISNNMGISNRFIIGDYGRDSGGFLNYYGYEGTGQGFSYLRCVKGDIKSVEDKIGKLGATF